MFESLGDKLANAFKKFKNKGKLTEADEMYGLFKKETEVPESALFSVYKIDNRGIPEAGRKGRWAARASFASVLGLGDTWWQRLLGGLLGPELS